jgi:tetratricopeptide (TPR) repeat protein
MEEAKAYFDQSMELLDALPDSKENQKRRISMLANQANVFLLLLQLPSYYDYLMRYEFVVRGTDDDSLRGIFYVRSGHCEMIFGLLSKSIDTLSKAAELCEATGNPEDAGYAYCIMGWDHLWKGDLEAAIRLKEECLAQMDKQFNLRTSVWALNEATLANSFLSRWNEAEKLGEKALRLAEDYADNSNTSWSAWCLCALYTLKGDLNQAINYGDLAVQKALTPGDMAVARIFVAWARCRAGIQEIEVLEPLVPVFRTSRFVVGELFSTAVLGESYWLAREYDRAKEVLDEHLELQSRCRMELVLPWVFRLLGEIAVDTGSEQAISYFEKSIEVSNRTKNENELALAYVGMGRYLKQQGKVEEARKHLTDALEIFERLGTLTELDKVRVELAGLPATA